MTTPRGEIIHQLLRMVDSGLATRTPTGCPFNPWRIQLDDHPASYVARMGLEALNRLQLVAWRAVGNTIELAIITPQGLRHLHLWDTELFDDPRYARSSRPLAGMDIDALNTEAARLINEAFKDPT